MTKKERFSGYFDRYYGLAFGFALKRLKDRDTAEEIVQDSFIKLWENLEEVQHEAAIKSYLFTILKNKIIDLHRKGSTRTRHENEFSQNQELSTALESDWELSQFIDRIYASLKPPTDEIFQLSRQEGLTYPEIAEKKAISIKTVEAHISKALAVFRKGLKDYL